LVIHSFVDDITKFLIFRYKMRNGIVVEWKNAFIFRKSMLNSKVLIIYIQIFSLKSMPEVKVNVNKW
jgi:hypothetical protein